MTENDQSWIYNRRVFAHSAVESELGRYSIRAYFDFPRRDLCGHMKTKARLIADCKKESVRADKNNDAFIILFAACQEIRREACQASSKGNSISPAWLIQYLTDKLTRAEIKRQ